MRGRFARGKGFMRAIIARRIRPHRFRSCDRAWRARGVRAGAAAAFALGVPILFMGWFLLVDHEAARRQRDLGDFLLARAAAGGIVLSLVFAMLVRAAAERWSGATSPHFYALAALACVFVGIALMAILLRAAPWIWADQGHLKVGCLWVIGPWICGGVSPLLFRRWIEE